MAENINVQPTPIQRNKFDVAMELTELHTRFERLSPDQISSTFARYYALAEYCEVMSLTDLQKLLPKSLLDQVGEFKGYC